MIESLVCHVKMREDALLHINISTLVTILYRLYRYYDSSNSAVPDRSRQSNGLPSCSRSLQSIHADCLSVLPLGSSWPCLNPTP